MSTLIRDFKKVGKLIARKLRKRKLSAAQIAKLVGIKKAPRASVRAALISLETGRAEIVTVAKYARVAGVYISLDVRLH